MEEPTIGDVLALIEGGKIWKAIMAYEKIRATVRATDDIARVSIETGLADLIIAQPTLTAANLVQIAQCYGWDTTTPPPPWMDALRQRIDERQRQEAQDLIDVEQGIKRGQRILVGGSVILLTLF